MIPGYYQRSNIKPTIFYGRVTVLNKMTEFLRHRENAAPSDANIIMRGESGTGKELVAKIIHDLSCRSKGLFQARHCATLTSELMQSELFGSIKGSFTSAIADRKVLFKAAHNSTLFLNEIAEIPQDLHHRLLRVLQDRWFSPFGSFKVIKSNIGLVSATHRSLLRMPDEGYFSVDLKYRIRVLPLFLPCLAERDRDIEVILWLFIDANNRQGLRSISAVEPAALNALLNHPWPGNVRELRKNVEYAFVMGEGEDFRVEDLTPEGQGIPAPEPSAGGEASIRHQEIDSIIATLRETVNR